MKYLVLKKGELPYSETFITALGESFGPEAGIVHGGPLKLKVRNNSVDTPALPYWRQKIVWSVGRRLLSDPEATSLKQVLRALQPSVVLAQFGPTGVNAMQPCESMEISLVTFFHGYDATKKSILQKYGADYRRLFAGTKRMFIAVSRSLRRILIELGAAPERVFVTPCGAQCDLFSPDGSRMQSRRFLAVGRFTEKKAPHLTVLAFSRVLTDFPDATLRMVGDGILLGPCKALVRSLGIGDRVTFTGALSHKQVRKEMARATVFVQHSLTASTGDQEGTPVSIMEAGASGLPVVSTRHSGIPDLVIHEQTGLLVDECDVDGMAQGMKRLLEIPSYARSLGERAAERVHTYFDAKKLTARVQAIADWTVDNSLHKPPLIPDWLKLTTDDLSPNTDNNFVQGK